MFKKFQPFFIYADSPIHAGSGESTGVIDLEIQRDVVTELPVIFGQSLKGAFREYFELNESNKKIVDLIFGDEGTKFASSVSFAQANILLFPISTINGIFAYITSNYVLNEFLKFINLFNKLKIPELKLKPISSVDKCIVPSLFNDKVFLGNIMFKAEENKNFKEFLIWLSDNLFSDRKEYFYIKEIVLKNTVLVNDNIFKELTKSYSDIVYRNKIGENGIVDEGSLWSEEYLPSNSILYSGIFAGTPKEHCNNIISEDDIIEKIKLMFNQKNLFIGGNKTIGKGMIFINFLEG